MTDTSDVWPAGQPIVGQIAERSRTVQPEDIEHFTRISGDRNPIHYDEKLAAATSFGGIVVLVMSSLAGSRSSRFVPTSRSRSSAHP